MAVQTSYSNTHSPAYEGMKASTSEVFDTQSYFAEGGNILAGRGVVFGTDPDKQCELPAVSSTDALIAGVSMYEVNRVQTSANASENQDRPITIVKKGVLWAAAIDGAAPGDPVYLVINAAGGVLGTFRSTATATAGHSVLVSGAKWLSTATAGNLAKLSINRA